MRTETGIGLVALTIVAGIATAAAPPAPVAPSAAVENVLACLDVADSAQRLACFETQARALKAATARREVVVIDQAEIQKTKRSLFGFTLPHIPLFDSVAQAPGAKGKKIAEPEIDRLQTTIRSAARGSNGLWNLELEDGARWQQVEFEREVDEPRAGMKIDIRKASFGTYFARIGSGITMRIRRVS